MTKKLIMCQGLPGSGKNFWSSQQIPENSKGVIIVTKDDIRTYLTSTIEGWFWSPANEADVIKERDKQVIAALKHPDIYLVISADTNFGKKHEARLRELAREAGAEFEIKSFLDVDINLCIERDSKREGKAKVGESVIRKMASQNNLGQFNPTIEPYTPNTSLKSGIICDLDGTLCLNNGKRSPYNYSKVGGDECNYVIKQILETYYRFMEWDIIYLSGREDSCREVTQEWLRKFHCPPGQLFMRNTGDHRKDFIVKYELFNNHVRYHRNVRFVLDDRNQVVEMWRKLGLTCLQVAEGNF